MGRSHLKSRSGRSDAAHCRGREAARAPAGAAGRSEAEGAVYSVVDALLREFERSWWTPTLLDSRESAIFRGSAMKWSDNMRDKTHTAVHEAGHAVAHASEDHEHLRNVALRFRQAIESILEPMPVEARPPRLAEFPGGFLWRCIIITRKLSH